jgi:hypothetical protein
MSADPEISCPPTRSQLSAHPDLRVSVGTLGPVRSAYRGVWFAIAHIARPTAAVAPVHTGAACGLHGCEQQRPIPTVAEPASNRRRHMVSTITTKGGGHIFSSLTATTTRSSPSSRPC